MKVMTWNVENLFRPGGDSGPASQEVYESKLEGLAAKINAEAPDTVGLQEVGEPEALDDLVRLLDGEWERRLSQHPDRRGIRVGWLSRHPITASEDLFAFPQHIEPVQVDDEANTQATMGRGALMITADIGDESVQLVTTHLKSKLLTFPGNRHQPRDEDERARFAAYALYRRAAEAASLRVAVTAALGGLGRERPLVLAGDLNDTPQAATTQLLLGPPGSEISTSGFQQPDQGDQQRLWNLAPRMPEKRNFSRKHRGQGELIDHILVSAALVGKLISVEALVDEGLPSITEDPDLRRREPSSDHAPVVATFVLET